MRKRDLVAGERYATSRPGLELDLRQLRMQAESPGVLVTDLACPPADDGRPQVLARIRQVGDARPVRCDHLTMPLADYRQPLNAQIARIEAAEQAASELRQQIARLLDLDPQGRAGVLVAVPREEIRHVRFSGEAAAKLAERTVGYRTTTGWPIAERVGAPLGSVTCDQRSGALYVAPEALPMLLASLGGTQQLAGLADLVGA